MLAYDNPALNLSSTTVNVRQETDLEYLGSNNFVVVDDSSEQPSTVDEIKSWLKKKVRRACTKKILYRRLPFLNWIQGYDMSCAVGDLVAGITVGLTLIPQALAFSHIVNVPTEYGLYSSFLGCFVYIFFGSCKDVAMGPTAIIALLTFQSVNGRGVEHTILLCFLTGLVQIIMGVLGLGFIVDFVSGPVSSGFTSAVALIIVTSQVKDILGIKASGVTFVSTWNSIFHDIHNTRPWDAVLGISSICILLSMRVVGSLKIGPTGEDNKPNKCQTAINKILWLLGTARNTILVVVCGLISYAFSSKESSPFKVIGFVPQGLPSFKLPPFGYEKLNNSTVVESYTFFTMVSNLGNGVIVLPLIGLLENIAVCKAFANGKPVDVTQELLAIGLCNIANSFVQSFPGTGALARSAVNNASGVRTPLEGLYAGILVVVALLFFTPYFYFIPKAALGAILIAAVVFMVEVKVIRPMWRTKKSCFIVGFATFIACLVLPLEVGILVGIGINLLFILYHAARPKICVEKLQSRGGAEYLMITPDRCLIFPSVEYVRNLVIKNSIRQGIPVVIDCSHIYGADYTAATVIESLTHDFAARAQPLFFYNLKPSVCSVFEGLSPKDFLVFYSEDEVDDLLKNRSCVKKIKLINE